MNPCADGGCNGQVVDSSKGFVISGSESKWTRAVSGAVDAVSGVLIQPAFWAKDIKLVIEAFQWEVSVAHVAVKAMEDFGALIARCVPAAIRSTIWARSAVFGFFQILSNVFLGRHLNFVTGNLDAVGVLVFR